MTGTSDARRDFHFISGLLRAGAILLSAILRQNPKFHAGMTRPVGPLFSNLIGSASVGTELSTMVSVAQRQRLSHGLFDSLYADLPNGRRPVFDTNRAWTANLSAVTGLFPVARMLCGACNVAWVMDSLGRQVHSSAFDEQLGLGGLHTVHRKVEPTPRNTILPPDLFEQCGRLNFWKNLKDSCARIITGDKAEPLPVSAVA
ncbi:hypothetical protein [Kordiimonas aestuarii]|uniref:hypothetical protein n=1 Tax=Kordiimonas aestuarii TaxID=1005925 RepID=UPI0021D0DCB0|nr:hypothetical protein [Kordiimonas aestuarii]